LLSNVSNEAVAEKHFSRTIEDELLPGDDFEHYDLLFSDSVSAQTPDYTPDNDDGFADTRSLPDVQAVGIARKHLSEMTEDELLPGDDFEDYDLLFSETASVELIITRRTSKIALRKRRDLKFSPMSQQKSTSLA